MLNPIRVCKCVFGEFIRIYMNRFPVFVAQITVFNLTFETRDTTLRHHERMNNMVFAYVFTLRAAAKVTR